MQGHIRKRGEKSWALVIELDRGPDGKRRQKWHTVRGSKKDAQRELNRLLTEVDNGSYVEPQKITLGVYLERWLDYTRSSVAERTHEFYAEAIEKHLTPGLGHIALSKLQPLQIQAYYKVALLSGRRDGKGGLSPQTVSHHHRVLFAALRQAVKWQLLARNPCEAVEPPKIERKEMQALDMDRSQALLQAAEGSWLRLPILLAIAMGLRRGEILGLRWQDIDLAAGALKVRHSIGKGGVVRAPKTSHSRRAISLPPSVVDALKEQQARQLEDQARLEGAYQGHGFVVARQDGSAYLPDHLTHAFAKLAKRAGFTGLRFHDLRHTSATLLLAAGVDVKTIASRLGHSSAVVTLNTYAHMLRQMDEHAASKMDLLLTARKPSALETFASSDGLS